MWILDYWLDWTNWLRECDKVLVGADDEFWELKLSRFFFITFISYLKSEKWFLGSMGSWGYLKSATVVLVS